MEQTADSASACATSVRRLPNELCWEIGAWALWRHLCAVKRKRIVRPALLLLPGALGFRARKRWQKLSEHYASGRVHWTREEWTDFLANECQMKRGRAHQIAAQLVEQEFCTGHFKSFANESMRNWEFCKGLLMEIGFKDMDVFPFIVALQEHISESAKEETKKDCKPPIVRSAARAGSLVSTESAMTNARKRKNIAEKAIGADGKKPRGE